VIDKKLKITSIETNIADVLPIEHTASTDTINYAWVKKLTILTTLIWAVLVVGLLIAILKIETNWQTYSALQWTTIIGLILGPALMIFVAGYALKQLAKISGHAYTLTQAVNALYTPDTTVIRKSKIMAEVISAQVDQVNEKLDLAVGRLSSMEEIIQIQTQALDIANQGSRETVDKINASVKSQNATLASMTASLDESMDSLSKNLTMHTDNLAKSVQIAEQKIKEARISVEGATAKINSASDIVRSNTVQASATLSASHEDIKSLGDIIRLRSEELDEVYQKHAGELTAMIEHLRDEQTALGASMEERLVKMRDLSLSAQASAESLTKASAAGKETIEALAAAASLADNAVKTRFSEMRDMVQYSTEHAQSISDMAAKRVQDSLELTRKEIIRIEQEMADLQTRIGDKKHKSLELIPDDRQVNDDVDASKRPRGKKTRTRLKLKPIIDIETELEQTEVIEPEPIPDPEIQPVTQPVTKAVTQPLTKAEEQAPLVLNDLLEPGTKKQWKALKKAAKNGSLSEEEINTSVRRILKLIIQSKKMQNYQYGNNPNLEGHAKIARQSATEGMILLKNEHVLPIQNAKNIALLGVTSYDFIAGGTGSGDVNEAYTVSLEEGLKNAGFEINQAAKKIFETHKAKHKEEFIKPEGFSADLRRK